MDSLLTTLNLALQLMVSQISELGLSQIGQIIRSCFPAHLMQLLLMLSISMLDQ